MGVCHSMRGNGEADDDRAEGDACPTVFALEQAIEVKRGAAKRMHVNLVNIEFRRGLFEMYVKGYESDIESDSEKAGGGGGGCSTAVAGHEGKEIFVVTHKASREIFV